jgi:hypothetical protein
MSSNCGKLTSIDFDWGVDDYVFPDTVIPKLIAGDGAVGKGWCYPTSFEWRSTSVHPAQMVPRRRESSFTALTFPFRADQLMLFIC